MPKQKFTKTDITIIVLFFVLYIIGYAWLIEPKKDAARRTERNTMLPQKEITQTRTEKRQLKSLSAGWPLDLGKYFYTKLTTTQQMFDYVAAHKKNIVKQMQDVRRRGISHQFDEASYYQDHYDEYQDDPEDEIRFPPEIFDANDD